MIKRHLWVLSLEHEMPPTCSCGWTLGPQLLVLSWKTVKFWAPTWWTKVTGVALKVYLLPVLAWAFCFLICRDAHSLVTSLPTPAAKLPTSSWADACWNGEIECSFPTLWSQHLGSRGSWVRSLRPELAAEGMQRQPEPHKTSSQKTKVATAKILPLLKVHFVLSQWWGKPNNGGSGPTL